MRVEYPMHQLMSDYGYSPVDQTSTKDTVYQKGGNLIRYCHRKIRGVVHKYSVQTDPYKKPLFMENREELELWLNEEK